MDAKRPSAVLEIADDKVKFMIGLSSKDPAVLYYDERPLPPGLVEAGEIKDEGEVARVIASFSSIKDEGLSLKVNADSLSLVLPCIGMEIYQNVKTSQTVSDSVSTLDVSNVLALVNREAVPGGNATVDIVPDFFTLDGKDHYKNPPIGEKAVSLSVQAKVHTLPEKLVSSYKRTVAKAGFRVNRTAIDSFLFATLLEAYPRMPKTSFYVDIGARLTSVSLLSEGSPYSSCVFHYGGDDLNDRLVSLLGLSPLEAKNLKEDFGYDTRNTLYQPILCRGEEGNLKVRQKDLNAVIEEYFRDFSTYLSNAVLTLSQAQGTEASRELLGVPIVLGGGGSLLYGIEKLLDTSRGSHPLIRYIPRAVGALDPSMASLLGMLSISSTYRGSLWDDGHRLSTLTRGE